MRERLINSPRPEMEEELKCRCRLLRRRRRRWRREDCGSPKTRTTGVGGRNVKREGIRKEDEVPCDVGARGAERSRVRVEWAHWDGDLVTGRATGRRLLYPLPPVPHQRHRKHRHCDVDDDDLHGGKDKGGESANRRKRWAEKMVLSAKARGEITFGGGEGGVSSFPTSKSFQWGIWLGRLRRYFSNVSLSLLKHSSAFLNFFFLSFFRWWGKISAWLGSGSSVASRYFNTRDYEYWNYFYLING